MKQKSNIKLVLVLICLSCLSITTAYSQNEFKKEFHKTNIELKTFENNTIQKVNKKSTETLLKRNKINITSINHPHHQLKKSSNNTILNLRKTSQLQMTGIGHNPLSYRFNHSRIDQSSQTIEFISMNANQNIPFKTINQQINLQKTDLDGGAGNPVPLDKSAFFVILIAIVYILYKTYKY